MSPLKRSSSSPVSREEVEACERRSAGYGDSPLQKSVRAVAGRRFRSTNLAVPPLPWRAGDSISL